MSLEREAMKGKLVELQQQEKKLKLKIEGFCTSIRHGLNYHLTPIDDLEIPQIAEQMDSLVLAWSELQVVESDIARLQKELA